MSIKINKNSYMVSNDRRTKLLPKILAGQFLALLAISAIAGTVIFYTQGYRFNIKNFKVQKTGIVVLDFSPVDAGVFINNKQKTASKGSYVYNYLPGSYNLSIKKDGFINWERSINISPSSVNSFDDIVLFKKEVQTSELTDSNKIDLLNTPTDVLASNAKDSLYYSSNEIWVGDNLVTRLSTPILKAVWYSDLSHIIYQQGDEVRIIDISGYNDTFLFKLEQSTPTNFCAGNHGQEIYFLDSGKYMVAKIR